MIKKFISTFMVFIIMASILIFPASAISTDTHSGASMICDECGERLVQCEDCNIYYHSTLLTECPQTIEHIKFDRSNNITWIAIGVFFLVIAIGLVLIYRKEKETTSKMIPYFISPLFCLIGVFIIITSVFFLTKNISLLNQY